MVILNKWHANEMMYHLILSLWLFAHCVQIPLYSAFQLMFVSALARLVRALGSNHII